MFKDQKDNIAKMSILYLSSFELSPSILGKKVRNASEIMSLLCSVSRSYSPTHGLLVRAGVLTVTCKALPDLSAIFWSNCISYLSPSSFTQNHASLQLLFRVMEPALFAQMSLLSEACLHTSPCSLPSFIFLLVLRTF